MSPEHPSARFRKKQLPNTDPGTDQPQQPTALFVYGTLLIPEVLEVVIGRDPVRAPASLVGWRVSALPDQVYPTMYPADGLTVDGQLLTGMSVAERAAIDAYESPEYATLDIHTSVGPAYTYAVHGYRTRRRLMPDDDFVPAAWDVETFRREQLPTYLEHCRAWRQRYDSQQ